MENQPNNAGHGRPGAMSGDPVNQTDTLADARGISDLSNNNKGSEEDKAAYVDDSANLDDKTNEEPIEEDFEPFNLDEIDQ